MTKKIVLLVAVLFVGSLCDQSHPLQAQVPASQLGEDAVQQSAVPAPAQGPPPSLAEHTEEAIVEVRKKQVPAICATFARRTSKERAIWLAEVCYQATEGTDFTPMDLAEIALAETGSHRLSSRAVSSAGAMGVWQLMPERALSHGYQPREMREDVKCADAAVKELAEKVRMAKGNLSRAKRLYCGGGRAARIYDAKRRQYREEILRELEKSVKSEVAVRG